ncbi:MAG: alpha/beta hydrolase [Variibacter sp.]|nr:alpha/beta hydrolase [Variibacter sp.]
MTILKWVALLVAGYGALVVAMYLAQRRLMYVPDPVRHAPAAWGLPEAEEVELHASDGERLIAWHVAPRGNRPLILYFQGNAGGLNLRADRFRRLVADGFGLLALGYRGYGGSTGRPSEAGLLRDAEAAYRFAASRYPAARIALWGESLGTGVAVALAAERPVARVILESPFTAAVDIAASIYWFVPVRLLMRDQFRSDERIARVSAPVMVLHGARDAVVPIRFGERLYSLITAPKRFVRLAEAGHNDHDAHGGLEAAKAFLAGEPP